MDLSKIIAERRSVFPEQYINKPIARETIEELLEAANWAPTHKHTEPWRFKVLQGESIKNMSDFLTSKYKEITPEDKFSEFKQRKLATKPRMAGAIIAICMQVDPKGKLPEWEEVAATAMAVQNMWLLASHKGLGSYWSSPDIVSELGDFFNLAQGEKCLGFFYLGHYEGEKPEGRRIPIEEKTVWM
ncbi:nitroreductase [Leeuwenhoekiella sp. A16]|uniref:nitroreductase family protein n=1 Tax=unclassified Leeuwenhoekiella TaxID=2615029 RepID=UPI003A7F7C63